MSMEIAILGFLQAVTVAVIGGLFARESKRRNKELSVVDARAIIRAEESRLSMKLMSASVGLGTATAKAVRDGHTNGTMEAALEEAESVKREYYNFVNTVASKQIAE